MGPKSKKRKHRKVPNNNIKLPMESFFDESKPISRGFFFDINFCAGPIVKRVLVRGANYRKICKILLID